MHSLDLDLDHYHALRESDEHNNIAVNPQESMSAELGDGCSVNTRRGNVT
jgi:hypothetical protein